MEIKNSKTRSYSGNICKCCLGNRHSLKDLWEVNFFEGDSRVYGEMITKCFAISWLKPVNRTELICESCINILLIAFKFKRDVLASEQILLLQLKDEDNEYNEIVKEDLKDGNISQEHLIPEYISDNLEHSKETIIEDNMDELKYFEVYLEDSIRLEPVKKEKDEDNECNEIVEEDLTDYNIIPEHLIPEEDPENICDNLERSKETLIEDNMEELKCFEVYLEESISLDPFKREKDVTTDSPVLKHPSPGGLCDQDMPSSSTLKQHMCTNAWNTSSRATEEQGGQTANKFTCDICKRNFKSKTLLSQHILHNHKYDNNSKKLFTCKTCTIQFSQRSHLITHQRLHTGEKPYSCKICNKPFSRNSTLIRHQRIHTGDKPYSCKTCNKQFSLRSSLITHQRVHTGDKPYSCKICNKQFAVSSTLIRHQRVHTGEKPYSCKVCSKQFSQSSILFRHQRVHTGEKP